MSLFIFKSQLLKKKCCVIRKKVFHLNFNAHLFRNLLVLSEQFDLNIYVNMLYESQQ